MIYVMNEKYFEKNIKKMAKQNDYIIIVAYNYGVIDVKNDESLASKYSNAHTAGGLCPEFELYGLLKKIKKNIKVSKSKLEREIHNYTHEKSFVNGVAVSLKGLVSGKRYNKLNVIIVFPNIVYKYLKDIIIKRFIKLAKVDFEFIRDKDYIDSNGFSCMKSMLSDSQLDELISSIKHIEKKYKLKYDRDDDE